MATRSIFLTGAASASAVAFGAPTRVRAQGTLGLGGTWYNELNSQLTVVVGTDGQLTGTYISAVGGAAGTYTLVGRYDSQPGSSNVAVLGFTVQWRNASGNTHSATSWTGQYQPHGGYGEQIFTTWLLTIQTMVKDNWSSTRVGRDVFLRRKRTQAEINAHLGLGNFSEPAPLK